jgi:predicted SAM-dependent methyltransferase
MIIKKLEEFKKSIEFLDDIKIIVGDGGLISTPDWISTDIDLLDVTDGNKWDFLFGDKKISNIFSEHVWEHLSEEDSEIANRNIFKNLKIGGRFRIAVPDGYNPDPDYIEYVKPGGYGAGAHDHKRLYNYTSLKEDLEKIGFKVNLLEYWDESGNFNFIEWDVNLGKVIRSKRFDSRNENGKLNYTSLIVDAIKPEI